MASTVEGRRLTEAQRLAQGRLGAEVVRQAVAAFALLDPENIDRTIERWLAVMVPLVQRNRRTSAQMAADYIEAFRFVELGEGQFTPELVEDIPAEQVATSLIVTGPARIRAARGPAARVLDTARAESAAAAMRHVLNGGRDTVVATTNADRRALGWARATSGRACGFCAMLASRGPVFGDDTVGFRAHDRCTCSAEPVYRRDAEWPAGARDYQRLWQDTTAGLSGKDARNAFRQAVEA